MNARSRHSLPASQMSLTAGEGVPPPSTEEESSPQEGGPFTSLRERKPISFPRSVRCEHLRVCLLGRESAECAALLRAVLSCAEKTLQASGAKIPEEKSALPSGDACSPSLRRGRGESVGPLGVEVFVKKLAIK